MEFSNLLNEIFALLISFGYFLNQFNDFKETLCLQSLCKSIKRSFNREEVFVPKPGTCSLAETFRLVRWSDSYASLINWPLHPKQQRQLSGNCSSSDCCHCWMSFHWKKTICFGLLLTLKERLTILHSFISVISKKSF